MWIIVGQHVRRWGNTSLDPNPQFHEKPFGTLNSKSEQQDKHRTNPHACLSTRLSIFSKPKLAGSEGHEPPVPPRSSVLVRKGGPWGPTLPAAPEPPQRGPTDGPPAEVRTLSVVERGEDQEGLQGRDDEMDTLEVPMVQEGPTRGQGWVNDES